MSMYELPKEQANEPFTLEGIAKGTFQAFKLDGNELEPHGKPRASKEAVEKTIKINADLLGDVTYIVLPVYTSQLPIPPFKSPTKAIPKDADEYFGKPLAVIKSCGGGPG